MKMDKKKLAAAMAAVTAYIKTGEQAAVDQNLVSVETIPGGAEMPAPSMNLWGVTGRQALMQASTQMQLRMFK